MPLKKATRLGPYEILELRGKGGMGEVYHATDTRLDRDVAIKVLPEEVSADPKFRRRLQHEAKAISRLQHPNVCTLFEFGSEDSLQYLVMEYLPGEALSERLASGGPLALPVALGTAAEIAAGVDAAHRENLVHRDLKPGNVMLTRTGAKVLDFGLAEHASRDGDLTLTLATQALSGLGRVRLAGTLPYMSPEQVQGKVATHQSDIWAIGCILYEMIVGSRPFLGATAQELLGAILHQEPVPLTVAVPETPVAVEHLVQRCLAKDPEERWQNAGDLNRELLWLRDNWQSLSGPDQPSPEAKRRRIPWGWIAGGLLAGLLVAFLVRGTFDTEAPIESPPSIRFDIDAPIEARLGTIASGSAPAISPDGDHLVFGATDIVTGAFSFWRRDLSSNHAERLGFGGSFPFWSPDGQELGFELQGRLNIASITNPAPQTISETRGLGGSWNKDGILLHAQHDGIYQISRAGGDSRSVTKIDEAQGDRHHAFPSFLSDGRHFVYTAISDSADRRGIWLASLDSSEPRKLLADDSNAIFTPPGTLLFVRDGSLMAQDFVTKSMTLEGSPRPLAKGVVQGLTIRYASFAASQKTLVYRTDIYQTLRLVWQDRSGRLIEELGEPAAWGTSSISPDDRHVVTSQFDRDTGNWDLYFIDLTRGSRQRVLRPDSGEFAPVWSPGGASVIFTSTPNQVPDLYRLPATGLGEPERVTAKTGYKVADQWHQDTLVYSLGGGVWTTSLNDGSQAPLMEVPYQVGSPRISPDGRFIAYAANDDGNWHVYIQSYPDLERSRIKVSYDSEGSEPGSGVEPRWRSDGKELFYLALDERRTMMAFTFDPDSNVASRPTKLFPTDGRDYDVTADGERFLVRQIVPGRPEPFKVVLNWNTDLE